MWRRLRATATSVRAALNRTVVPVQLPIGEERHFRGIVDVVAQKAYSFQTDGSGKFTESPIPADLTEAAQAAE